MGTQRWGYFYEQIQGYAYEPEFIYTLKVKSKKPPLDSPHITYYLVKELAKE